MAALTKELPGSILASGFTTTQQKALNHFLDAFSALQGVGNTAEINAAIAAALAAYSTTAAMNTAINGAITTNNALYINKALLKSTTAAAADFAAYKVAIAAIP